MISIIFWMFLLLLFCLGRFSFIFPFYVYVVKLRRVLQTSLIFIYSLCELGIMMSDRLWMLLPFTSVPQFLIVCFNWSLPSCCQAMQTVMKCFQLLNCFCFGTWLKTASVPRRLKEWFPYHWLFALYAKVTVVLFKWFAGLWPSLPVLLPFKMKLEFWSSFSNNSLLLGIALLPAGFK